MNSEVNFLDWIFKAMVGILGWIGVRLHSRVDALEKERANVTDVKALETKLEANMAEMRKSFSDQNTTLLRIMERLPRNNHD